MTLKEQVSKLLNGKPANFHVTKEVAKLIVMHTGTVSTDDIRFYVEKFDPSPAIIGAALKSLVEEGVLVKKERKPTDRKSSKSREIVVYSRP